MKDKVYSVIDTETTGLSPIENRIIDIAIISIQNGKVINKYQTLINPHTKLPKFITNYTGIKQKQVDNAPDFFDVAYNIKDLISDTIIVAHNAPFDVSFLTNEFIRTNNSLITEYLCTVNLCKRLYPNLVKRNLDEVTKHFNIKINDRHRAMGDAEATALVFNKIQEENDVIWSYVLKSLKKSNINLKSRLFQEYL